MRYTKEQITTALQILSATESPMKVKEILGYPSSTMLYQWRKKYPELCHTPDVRHYQQASEEIKRLALRRCFVDGEDVKSVAKDIGYSYSSIYNWARQYRRNGELSLMKKAKRDTPSSNASNEIDALKEQIYEMQMEMDILKETINVLKKDPGVDLRALKNREKAVIIGAPEG